MSDAVDHPAHYEQNNRQTIQLIEGTIEGLDSTSAFLLGNVLKYVIRAGYKDDQAIDIGKANNYAHRLTTGRWRWEDKHDK